MRTDQPGLFGEVAPAERVRRAPFYLGVAWETIRAHKPPSCGHCQMAAALAWVSEERSIGVLSATMRRTGRDGSILDLCEQHAIDQEERDRPIQPFSPQALIAELAGDVGAVVKDRALSDEDADRVARRVVHVFLTDLLAAERYRMLAERIRKLMPGPRVETGAEEDALAEYVEMLHGRAT